MRKIDFSNHQNDWPSRKTDFSPVLACDWPNEAYNKFIYVYDNAFNVALPTKRIKLMRNYIKREPGTAKLVN